MRPELRIDAKSAAPLIVTAVMGAADFMWADRLRRAHFPPERNVLPAHISLFRHLPPSLEAELKAALAQAVKAPPPSACIEGLTTFNSGVAIAIHSRDLMAIWCTLAERFIGMLLPLDRAEPRFHITVQNKVDGAMARETRRLLEDQVRPRPLAIQGLAVWRYAGGPWAPVASYAFRG